MNRGIIFLILVVVSFCRVFSAEPIDLEKRIDKTPWLGVITSDYLKERVKKREPDGVLVDDFIEESPAKIFGINKGDVIQSIDGQLVKTQDEFEAAILAKKVGDKIKIKLLRDTKEVELEIVLEDTWNHVKDVLDKLGFKVRVVEVSDKPVNIIVSDVKENSISYNAKLAKGDLILGINRKTFDSLKEFGQIAGRIKLNENVLLTVVHDGSVLTKELSVNVAESKK